MPAIRSHSKTAGGDLESPAALQRHRLRQFVRKWNVDAAGVPTLAEWGRKLGVTAFDAKQDPSAPPILLVVKLNAWGRQRRGAAVGRCRQPAEAAAPGVAVPAGPPRETRARLAHDAPNPGAAGGDRGDVSVFNGAIDRWVELSAEEMYVPGAIASPM
jgi:hypothetical protein